MLVTVKMWDYLSKVALIPAGGKATATVTVSKGRARTGDTVVCIASTPGRGVLESGLQVVSSSNMIEVRG